MTEELSTSGVGSRYPQVYQHDGSWVGMFYTGKDARDWVKHQADPSSFEISFRRP